jgi:hypothetical protein
MVESVALPRLGLTPLSLYDVPLSRLAHTERQTTYAPLGISRTQTSKLTLSHFTAFLGIITPDVSTLHLHLSHGISDAV